MNINQAIEVLNICVEAIDSKDSDAKGFIDVLFDEKEYPNDIFSIDDRMTLIGLIQQCEGEDHDNN